MQAIHHSQSGTLCKYIHKPELRKEPDVAGSVTTRVPADGAPSSNPEFPFRGTPFVPPSDDGMGRCGASFVGAAVAWISSLDSGFVESCS